MPRFLPQNLLTPVTPSKIVCVGRNYREHVQELGNQMPAEPLLFFKPRHRRSRGRAARWCCLLWRSGVDFEGELALVVGRRHTHNLKPEDDWRAVLRRIHAGE